MAVIAGPIALTLLAKCAAAELLGRSFAGRLASGVVDSVDGAAAVLSVSGLEGPPQERRVKQSNANSVLRIMVGGFLLIELILHNKLSQNNRKLKTMGTKII